MGDISTIVALHRLDRTHKPGGGVCAFVNNNSSALYSRSCCTYLTTVFTSYGLRYRFKSLNHYFVICTAYRTDDMPLSCFKNDFSFSLNSAMSLNIPIYILADVNIATFFDPRKRRQKHCMTSVTPSISHRL